MKIITCPNNPFLDDNKLYAIELWVTDYGFDYQFRQAFTIASLTLPLPEGAMPDTANPQHLDNCAYKTEKVAVFGPITERIAVKFNDFRARSDFADSAEYALPIDFLDDFNLKFNFRSRNISKDHQLFNIIQTSSASKESPIDLYGRTVGSKFISIQVPFESSPNEDWFIHLNLPDKELLKVSPESQIIDVDGRGLVTHQFLPIVKFNNTTASVAEDGTVDLSFQLFDPITNSNITTTETKVYLKTTGGRLSKQVVQTVGGAGTVKFIPEYLSASDTIKVSCGFKYFSGTGDCLITIV